MFIVRKEAKARREEDSQHFILRSWSGGQEERGGERRGKEGKGEQDFVNCTRNHMLLSEG